MNSAKYSYTKEVYEPFSQENKLGEVLVKGVQKSKLNSCIKTVASKRKVDTLFKECLDSQCSQCPESPCDQIVSSDMKKRSVDYDSGDDFVTPQPIKLATRNKGKRVSKIKKSGNKNSEKPAAPKILLLDDVLIKEGNTSTAKTSPLSGVECLSRQSSPQALPMLKEMCENLQLRPPSPFADEQGPPNFDQYSPELFPDTQNNYQSENIFKSLMDGALEDVIVCEQKLASQISNLDETGNYLKSFEHDAQNLDTPELRQRFHALVNGSAATEGDIVNPPTENSGGSCQTEGRNLELELLKAKRDIVLARRKFHTISFEIEKREFERKEREYRKGLDLLEKELSDLDADISRS